MEVNQLNEFSDQILQEACERWGLSDAQRISEAENLIYACNGPNGKVALRLTHPEHRSDALLRAELEWLSTLAQQAIPVVEPLPSNAASFLESIEGDASIWFACAFKWIDGKPVTTRGQTVPNNLIQQWGELTGKIVHSSIESPHAPYRNGRHHWHTPPPSQRSIAEKLLPELPQLSVEITAQQKEIAKLPANSDNYTLIHSDLHSGNVFLTVDQQLVALDFDDACHHYTLQEFAMPLYYSFFMNQENLVDSAKNYFSHFLTGYRKFHDIPIDDFEFLPLFFRLRDLDLMAIRHLWNIPLEHPWSQNTIRIYENGNSLSELPWKKWASKL